MSDKYARQRRWREKQRAEGLCVACGELYTFMNLHTGRPFRYCQRCRAFNAERYRARKEQTQPTLNFGEAA